jgi:hypothetical protein
MAGTLTPTPYQTVLDSDGVAVSGAKVYTYEAGTTTNATTYTTSALNVANANPIVADSAGRYVAYLAAGQNLRFIIKTSADVTIDDQDNIQSVPGSSVNLDIEGTVGEAVTAGQVVYLSSAAESTPLTAGKWYLTDSDAAATSTTPQNIGVAVSAIAINTSGTIRLAGEVASAGSVVVGTTYYVGPTPGALVSSAPSLSRQVGVGLTTSSLLLAATTAVVGALPVPITQDLLFTDATYDIGKSGATRPRDLFTSRNATVGADIVVSGTGPHAMGAVVNDYTRLQLDGAFTSGGASTAMFGMHMSGALTGHSADSDALVGTKLGNSIVTAGSSTTVAQLWVVEPTITVGAGSVTNSATVYIESAASEATNDYALWVDAGATRLDGTLTVGSTAATAINVAGGITAGSGDVALVNTAGKITALSGTEVADLSGAALTTLNASNVSSGTLANARLPSNVDLGGTLDVTGAAVCDSTLNVAGTASFAGAVELTQNAVLPFSFNRPTNSNGHAVGMKFLMGHSGSATAGEEYGNLYVGIADNSEGSEDGNFTLNLKKNGALDEIWRVFGASGGMGLGSTDDPGTDSLNVAGTLSKGSGSFKISHPLPALTDSKYLVHSFIEGPKADLIYRGTATLVDGEVTVDLDTAAGMTTGTWVLLCRDASCYTTNETGWHHVRGTVAGSTLTIECEEECDDVVSWMVVACRQDDHMKNSDTIWTDEDGYPIVEPDKPAPSGDPEP